MLATSFLTCDDRQPHSTDKLIKKVVMVSQKSSVSFGGWGHNLIVLTYSSLQIYYQVAIGLNVPKSVELARKKHIVTNCPLILGIT